MTSLKKHYLVKENEDDSGKKFTSKTHNNKSMAKLTKLWINKQLCDVKLMVEGREILTHRTILAINSDYFDAMFSHWYEEHRQETINLDGLSYDGVNTLLEYMYTGLLSLTTDNVQNVLVAADLLQMEEIKSLCCSYLEEAIDASNCLGMMNFGETYNCKELYDKCIQLIKLRFPTICQSTEFSSLPFQSLLKILKFDNLCLGFNGEETVVNAVVHWLEKSSESRLIHTPLLFSHVRFKYVKESVIQNLFRSSLFKDNEDLQSQIKNQLETDKQEERKPIQSVFVIGGFLQSRTGPLCPRLKSVERYNIIEDTWDKVADLPTLASGAQILNFHGRMFVTAFELISRQIDRNEENMSVLEYDPLHDKWKDATHFFPEETLQLFQECLQKCGNIVVSAKKNSIFIITDKSVYSLQLMLVDGEMSCNKAVTLPSVGHFQEGKNSHYSSIMCDNNLFVLGGDLQHSQLEIYPIADVSLFNGETWIKRASMLEPRSMFDVVELGGCIYALGGFNTRRVNTVERYNPQVDQWTYISCMNKERSHLKAVVTANMIYVMGGKSYSSSYGGARKVLNTCETYDPSTNKWTNVKPMNHSRCMFGATAF
ncbi:kelch-like protein 12 isoform X1 [Patella vulgata]|uniref:kelch-like protein 12 isoform X1 n=1 Tax=Patella vulgata TaxID=6465 RepID=UPI00218032AD|nr:kelch-like protein 12 isoform X1 [Patella vulgata]